MTLSRAEIEIMIISAISALVLDIALFAITSPGWFNFMFGVMAYVAANNIVKMIMIDE